MDTPTRRHTRSTGSRASRSRRLVGRRNITGALLVMALVAALLPLSSSNPVNAANGGGLFPWQLDDGSAGVAPIGAGFVLEESDLQFIL